MAKNRNDLDPEGLDLEILDLESLDDDFSFDAPEDKSPVRRFSTNFKRGFLEQTKAKVLLKRFLKSSLPDGYSRLWSMAEESKSKAQQMGSDLTREVGPELDHIAERIEKTLPKIKDRTPKRLYQRIESGVDRFREEQAQRDQGSIDQAALRRQEDESLLAEAVQGLTDASISEGERAQLEASERELRGNLEAKRFDVLNAQLGRVASGVERSVSFQDQISYKYQRKSLELQYRSFFALRDLRRFSEVRQQTQERAFTALVHNTGLPDHLKFEKAERVSFGVRDSLSSAIGDQVAQSLLGHLSSYAPQIQENLKNKLAETIRMGSGALSASEIGDGAGIDKVGAAGSMAGDTAGNWFRDVLLNRAAIMARPGMEKVGDKIGGQHHLISYFLNNMPSILQEYAQDTNQNGGIRGAIHKMVSSLAPTFFQNDELKDGSFQTIDRQAAFNQLTQRSIVEVIPGYLSRILQETRMIRTGTDDVEREVYDITSGRFTGYKAAKDAVLGRVVNENQRRNIDTALGDVVERYDPDQFLSDDARAALRERLLRDASSGEGRFDPVRYARGEGFADDTKDDVLEELKNFFQGQFDFDEKGKVKRDAENNARMNAFSDAFLNLRNVVPDPRAELNRMTGAGTQEILHDLGLINNTFGQNRVNYNKIWDLYRTETPRGIGPGYNPGGVGDVPRTHIKTSYEDQPSIDLRGKVSDFKETAKDRLRHPFKKRNVLPEFTSVFIEKLQTLDGQTLAKLVHWKPQLLGQLKRLDPEIELRIAPFQAKLRDKKPKLDRNTIQALWDLSTRIKDDERTTAAKETAADWASRGQDAAEELQGKVTGAYTSSREHLEDRAEDFRGNAEKWRTEASRRASTAQDAVRGRFRGTQADSYVGAQLDKTEYMEYLEDVQSLHQQQVDQQHSFFRAMREEMARGFKIRELPELTLGDGEGKVSSKKEKRGWLDIFQTGAGGIADYYKHAFGGIGKGMGKMFGGAGKMAGNLLGGIGKSKTVDIYVKGRPQEPVLLARDIDDGRYIDVNTEKVVKGVGDITGEVWDSWEEQVAVTQEEFTAGLYDRRGKSLLKTFAGGVLGFYNDVYLGGAKKALKSLPSMFHMGKDVLMPERDAYIPGEKSPRIRANLLSKDVYFDGESGEPIRRYRDISGEVVDRSGNIVVAADEIHQLVGRDGRSLESLGTAIGKLGRGAMSLPGKALKATWGATKSVAKKTFDLAGAVSDRVIGMVRGTTGMRRRDVDKMDHNHQVVSLLGGIYDLLLDRLPEPKRHRRGSWQEEFAEREAEREEAEDLAEEMETRKEGIFGRIGKGLGSLLGLFRDREDTLADIAENTEDMDGGTDIYGGGGSDSRSRTRRSRTKKPAPKGFWNKTKHFGGKGIRGVGRGIRGVGRAGLAMLGLGGAGSALARGAGAVGSGALATGKFALGGVGTAARVGATGLTAAVSAMGAPVALAGAATVGAGVAGFMAWRNHKATRGPFRELRLTQYGFPPGWFSGPANRILELEAYLNDKVSRDGPEPAFNLADTDLGEILGILDIDQDDEEALQALGGWFVGRFKPIFLSYHKAIQNMAVSTTLAELDDQLDDELGMDFLDAVKFPYQGSTPYAITANPFDPEEPIEVTYDDIRDKVKEVKERYKGSREEHERASRVSAVATGGTVGIARSVQRATENARQAQRGGQVLGRAGMAAATAVTGGTSTTNASDLVSRRSRAPEFRTLSGGRLTSLQAIRMRAYGVVDLQRSRVMAMLTLEDKVIPHLSVERGSQGTQMVFNGSPNDIFQEVAGLFGLSESGRGQEDGVTDRHRFREWFVSRFLEVFLTYAGAARVFEESSPLNNIERKLTTQQKFQVAGTIMAATHTSNAGTVAVWDLPMVVFEDPQLSSAKDYAQRDYRLLEQEAQDSRVSTPAQSAAEQTQAANNNRLSSGAVSAARAVSGMSGPSGLGADDPARSAIDRARSRWGSADTHRGPLGVQPPRAPGGTVGARGTSFSGLAQGNGGKWEEIPMPRANRSYEAARPTLEAVQEMTGVDANLLATFASIESAFDYTVKAPTSSATGWFQFINATWDGEIEKHADTYGIPRSGLTRAAIRELRKDPRINALMGAEFLKSNYKYLERKLGRKPTDTDLYLAHFFGAGTAYKFLKKDQNANAARLFSQQASANRSIFYKSGGQARTIGEVYALLDEKVSRHRYGDSGVSVNRTAANDEPDPIEPAPSPAGVIDVDGETMIQLAPEGVQGHMQEADSPLVTDAQRAAQQPRNPLSLNARASSTVNPLNNTGTGTTTAPGNTTGGGLYGQMDDGEGNGEPGRDPIVDHQDRVREQAAMADRRQQHQNEETQGYTREMGRLLNRQLEVQQSMRDYLKEIAATVGGQTQARQGESERNDERSTNDSSQPSQRSEAPRGSSSRPPVNMSRTG